MNYLILILVIVYILINLSSSVNSTTKENWSKVCTDKKVNDKKLDKLLDALHECDEKFDQDDDYGICVKESDYKEPSTVKRSDNLHWLHFNCDEKFKECYNKRTENPEIEHGEHEKKRQVLFIV